MKISKELKTGVITVLAIGLFIGGVNFLKGNSFFGGDDTYVAYFPNSGGLAPATSVYINGVIVGKVLSVENNHKGDSLSKVKITFNIQESNLQIPRGSKIEVGALDFFNKGLIITLNPNLSKGFYSFDEKIPGGIQEGMVDQLKAMANPVLQKVNHLMVSVDKTINSLQGFWDETATSEIEASMKVLKSSIQKLGNVADQVEDLVGTEKVRLGRIFANVESITGNLKTSNDEIQAIVGNAKKITDDLVTADYKSIILDAQTTIKKLNMTLEEVNSGKGSLGLLLKDDKLYNELVQTNKEVQELVNDINLHPERYIHFSVLGAKTKGVPLTSSEEKKLRKMLDSIPN